MESKEEISNALEAWIKSHRDEAYDERKQRPRSPQWYALDGLLNEVRDSAAEGKLPWETTGEDE